MKKVKCISGYYAIEAGELYNIDLYSIIPLDGDLYVNVYDLENNWMARVKLRRFDVDMETIKNYIS